MAITEMPIEVVMQRRTVNMRCPDDVAWAALAVLPSTRILPAVALVSRDDAQEIYRVSGLRLELHLDENESYFDNWAAPEPKIFVMWRMHLGRALPFMASVSPNEAACMLDSGESVDAVAMPPAVRAWLGAYLRENFQMPLSGERESREVVGHWSSPPAFGNAGLAHGHGNG